jgi:aspartate-semialdehyde dehydrogenase
VPGQSPLRVAAGKDGALADKIREDESITNGIHMRVMWEQIRKGAVLNAVHIDEILIQNYP